MSTPETSPEGKAPSEPSFEALMKEIDRLTQLLEKGELPLEEALAAYERGMALSKDAAAILERAEGRLVRLMECERGQIREVPLALDDADAP
jgi:exodeoxyribonuclease VII small subunit